MLATAAACGAAPEPPEAAPLPPPSPPAGGGATSGALPARPAPSAPTPAQPASTEGARPLPLAPGSGGADPPGGDAGASVAASPASGPCGGLAGDACGDCVCEVCSDELEACSGVAGCVEILACVRASGCSGRECYCGDASLTQCLQGDATGPCKDVVLAAPQGKAPSLDDLGAGPASDAALEVADCAQRRDCREVCGLSD